MNSFTPSYKIVKTKWCWGVEDVCGYSGVKIDALDKHPEDGRLEAEHENSQHHITEPRLWLVPNCGRGVDIRLEVKNGYQVQEDKGYHKILVNLDTVTLKRSEVKNYMKRILSYNSHFLTPISSKKKNNNWGIWMCSKHKNLNFV